jgi:hypothetical protein
MNYDCAVVFIDQSQSSVDLITPSIRNLIHIFFLRDFIVALEYCQQHSV